MYEKLYSATKNEQADVVLSGKFVIDTMIQNDTPSLIETCLKNIINRQSTAHITPHIFKKSLLEKENLKFIDTKLYPGEDIVFFTDTLCHLDDDKQISIVPEIFYHHIETGRNTAENNSYSSLQKIPLLAHHVYRLIQESRYKNQMDNELWTFLILTSYTSFIKTARNEGFITTSKKLKNIVSNNKNLFGFTDNCTRISKKVTIPKKIFALWLKRIIKCAKTEYNC
jgi:hypothetical protein